jgi:hypothetical protein
MIRPLIAALALSACTTATVEVSQGRVRDVLTAPRVQGSIDLQMLNWVRTTSATHFRLPHIGGDLFFAAGIAEAANERGMTLIVDGPLVSASASIARRMHRVHVVDPNAPWFGIHPAGTRVNGKYVQDNATWTAHLFRHGFGGPSCLAWYHQQPQTQAKTRADRIVYVSWNFLERGCK